MSKTSAIHLRILFKERNLRHVRHHLKKALVKRAPAALKGKPGRGSQK